MQISLANLNHITIIRHIAIETWKETYKDILSDTQFNYMIDMMYSNDALRVQIQEQNHIFLLIKEPDARNFKGFVSYETNYRQEQKTKIHKLYVLPECHGMGMGKLLIEEVISSMQKYSDIAITLNVNRNNKSSEFYKYMGFNVIGEENIDIGNGYLMEDYILELHINDKNSDAHR